MKKLEALYRYPDGTVGKMQWDSSMLKDKSPSQLIDSPIEIEMWPTIEKRVMVKIKIVAARIDTWERDTENKWFLKGTKFIRGTPDQWNSIESEYDLKSNIGKK